MNLTSLNYFTAFNTLNFSLEQFLEITTETQSDFWFKETVQMIFILVFSLLVIAGLSGNLLLCLVILRKGAKSGQSLFILNLAVSDIFTCSFSIPFTALRLLMKNWHLGNILCKMVPTLQAVYVFVSNFTILGIAVYRYYAIVQCQNGSSKKSYLIYVLPTLWIVSFVLALPVFISQDVETIELIPGQYMFLQMCVENWRSPFFRQVYGVIILITQFGLPIIVVGGLHILICRFMSLRIKLQTSSLGSLQRPPRSVMRHRKNVILLTVASLSFVVTWLPWTVINLLAEMNFKIFEGMNFHLLHTITHVFAMLSVCINPLVYGWFNTNLRREIEKMIFQKKFGRVTSIRPVSMATDI